MGLREAILAAKSLDEINMLLKRGDTFEFASRKTRNSWQRAAERRIMQLTERARVEQQAVCENMQVEPKETKRNRKRRKNA